MSFTSLPRGVQIALVNFYGEGKVPDTDKLDLATLEAKAPRWGKSMSNAVRAVLGQPVDTTTRMALSETERELVLAHRAKHAEARAWNDAIEACVATLDHVSMSPDQRSITVHALRFLLRKV